MSSACETPRPVSADLALFTVVWIWGINIPLTKVVLSELHPFGFNAVRLTLSTAVLGVLAWLEKPVAAPALPRGIWWRLVAVSVTGSLLYQTVFISGLARTTAGNGALIVNTAPLWTALIAVWSRVERVRSATWAGMGLAFLGTVWLAVEGGDVDLARAHLAGNLLVLAGAWAWAASTVMSKPLVAVISPTRLAFWLTALSLPAQIALGWPHLDGVWKAPAWTYGGIAFSGLFSTGIAYLLWNVGVRRVGPSQTAIYTNAVPVIALVVAWSFTPESATVGQIVGGALILAGLWTTRRGRSVRG